MKFNQFSILNQESRTNERGGHTGGATRSLPVILAAVLTAILLCACNNLRARAPQTSGSGSTYGAAANGSGQGNLGEPISMLQSRIDSLVNDSAVADAFIGIEIVALDSGTTIYRLNAARLFHPASNEKILTTAAAEHFLQGFRFVTPFLAGGKIRGGVLEGNLYVKGSGDPLLMRDDFDTVCERLRAKGISKIEGNLVGDVSAFDTVTWGAGWMADDEPDSDEPYLTPLSVDENSITVSVEPLPHRAKPRATIENPSSFVSLINHAVTSEDTLIPPIKIVRPHASNNFTAIGRIAPGRGVDELEVSVARPEMYFLRLLRERLKMNRISVTGKETIGRAKAGDTLASISHPIDSVIAKVNKQSYNLGAENILKVLGTRMIGGEGSSKKGLTAVKEYLQTLGIDSTRIILADGSGVSFYNAVSPDELVRVLIDQYRHKDTFDKFYRSLPIAGVDGTLHKRLHGTSAEGNVHAKTGTITGVSALSGYVTTRDGRLCAFSILLNHFPGPGAKLRDLEDAILTEVAGSSLGISSGK